MVAVTRNFINKTDQQLLKTNMQVRPCPKSQQKRDANEVGWEGGLSDCARAQA